MSFPGLSQIQSLDRLILLSQLRSIDPIVLAVTSQKDCLNFQDTWYTDPNPFTVHICTLFQHLLPSAGTEQTPQELDGV